MSEVTLLGLIWEPNKRCSLKAVCLNSKIQLLMKFDVWDKILCGPDIELIAELYCNCI